MMETCLNNEFMNNHFDKYEFFSEKLKNSKSYDWIKKIIEDRSRMHLILALNKAISEENLTEIKKILSSQYFKKINLKEKIEDVYLNEVMFYCYETGTEEKFNKIIINCLEKNDFETVKLFSEKGVEINKFYKFISPDMKEFLKGLKNKPRLAHDPRTGKPLQLVEPWVNESIMPSGPKPL